MFDFQKIRNLNAYFYWSKIHQKLIQSVNENLPFNVRTFSENSIIFSENFYNNMILMLLLLFWIFSFILLLSRNSRNPSLSWSLRIQGEVHFAQCNYLAAMQHYIKALIVSTQFFQRPWSPMQSVTGIKYIKQIIFWYNQT